MMHFNFYITIILSDGIPKVYHYQDNDIALVIVMDRLSDSFDKIQKSFKNTLPFEAIAVFAIEALEILKHIHGKGIIHRNLARSRFSLDLSEKKVILHGNFKQK